MGVKFPASSTMEFQMLNYRSFAQVILVGVLGHNAQVRQTKSGSAMLTFSVATKSSVKQATGGYQTVTTWHDCLMFGPRSEKLASALLKGTVVSLQGSLNYREVELKNGYKGKTCSILVEDVQILAEGKAQAPARAQAARTADAPAQASGAPDEVVYAASSGMVSEDEIPC